MQPSAGQPQILHATGSGGICFAAILLCLAGCDGKATTEPTIIIKPAREPESPRLGTDMSLTDNARRVPTGYGVLAGTVRFQGDIPKRTVLIKRGKASVDGQCCAAAADILGERLIVAPDGGVANVFVYLAKAPKGVSLPPVPAEPVAFDQKNCVFLPHALIVRTNQVILVKNGDQVTHNAHTYPIRNAAFNQMIPGHERSGTAFVYARPEIAPVAVKCDLHPWMRAWHLPLDHPYGALTDKAGFFEISNLPAGEHQFRVWHEKAGFLDRDYPVTIEANQTTRVEIPFHDPDPQP